MCTTKECSTIGGSPFAHSDESDMIQNFGCLPSNVEILSMRIHHDKTWACHSNPDKPCLGALNRLKELGYESKVVDSNLITEECDWNSVTSITPEFTEELRARDFELIKTRIKDENFIRRI
jgi:hypothetical protein